ncbi:hypothetical protein A5906_25700 [Bradyrhizobium sacchari]|uniref:Uncharacterized protein n=1 Tax=Bradyrhizobium sacchari TaxID=1399419 RepID=A0A560JY17_9BRAD|nr:hypothetical protein [Bradyrhizobium sacchari]OPY99139.1 hypothetical protein A5906_25700 [Bradyrhizobium sacchari]TWB63067.1 hypothetical protein FBZ94_103767 [Bradyrhizobium sacchari]TWB76003.1 hypothetical protein FBZ95_104183 [Bradyrhizobium sacchari]
MPAAFFETKPRAFNPVSASGLTPEALDSANEALKELIDWRNDIVEINRNKGERVLDHMAVATKALGWPGQVVDAARSQLKSVVELQVKTLDVTMEAWEEELKSPSPTASSSQILSKLNSLSSFPGMSSSANPIEVWIKLMGPWQRAWVEIFGALGKGQ